jgi:hypothetical protein
MYFSFPRLQFLVFASFVALAAAYPVYEYDHDYGYDQIARVSLGDHGHHEYAHHEDEHVDYYVSSL